MPCRVGITTDLSERESYWRGQYPQTFRNWEVLQTGLTKDEADAAEQRYARQLGCEANPGGRNVPGRVWNVYCFEHQNR